MQRNVTKSRVIGASVPVARKKGGKKRGKGKKNSNNVNLNRIGMGPGYSTMIRSNPAKQIDRFVLRSEKVSDIVGTSAFTNRDYFVNPGNSSLFPIFSKIASVYEQYHCRYLAFRFVPETYKSIASTASPGRVILATNHDPDEAAFTSSDPMENYWCSNKATPMDAIVHEIVKNGKSLVSDEAESISSFYVNTSVNEVAPTGQFGKFFDIGRFQLATFNNAVTTTVGELYVDYQFDMITPKQENPAGGSIIAAQIYGTPVSGTSPFGSNVLRIGSTFTPSFTANTFTLPAIGRYFIAYEANGSTSCSAFSSNLTPDANGAIVSNTFSNLGVNAAASSVAAGASVGSNSAINYRFIDVNALPCLVTMGTATFVGTAAYDLFICKVPSNLLLVPTRSVVTNLAREESIPSSSFPSSSLDFDYVKIP